jgi:hypothetical protein
MEQPVMGSITDMSNAASYATPEVRALFEEWARVVEDEIISFIKNNEKAQPAAIAETVKLSEESVLFFLGKLLREGRITVGELRVTEKR